MSFGHELCPSVHSSVQVPSLYDNYNPVKVDLLKKTYLTKANDELSNRYFVSKANTKCMHLDADLTSLHKVQCSVLSNSRI
jgi:hypothetical protein